MDVRIANNKPVVIKTINPVVQAFADANSIISTKEINALNNLYNGVNNIITAHGVGAVNYLNGISPTSEAVARKAIIYGTGNQTATLIGTAPTHSSDGVLFDGTTQGYNLGAYTNNKPMNEVLQCFSRSNTITISGVAIGFNNGAVKSQLFPRLNTGTSGFNEANYTAFSFDSPAIYIGYSTATTVAIWKDGIYQTPTSVSAPVTTLTGANNVYLGCRNLAAVAANFTNEQIAAVVSLWDGGVKFTDTEIANLSNIINAYNNNVV